MAVSAATAAEPTVKSQSLSDLTAWQIINTVDCNLFNSLAPERYDNNFDIVVFFIHIMD